MQAMSPLELTALPDGTRIRIVAVIRPHGLDTVMEALLGLGLVDVLVEQVRGYGRQKGHLEFYEEGGFQGGFVPKVRLEFCVDRAHAGEAVDVLCGAAQTGRIGDGKVFVQAVEPGDS